MPTAELTLTAAQLRALERLAASHDVPVRVAWRAHIVLDRATSPSDSEVAARRGTARATVALWRRRYEQEGIAGLQDRPRAGRRSMLHSHSDRDLPPSPEERASLVDITLERLLAAASQTISQRGFAATRMTDIARQAGVSASTLHYYFKTKQDILVRSLLWANERLVAQLAQATSPQDPPLVRLAKFIERTIPYPGTQRDEYLLEIDLWSHVRLHREVLPAWESFAERWIGQLRQIIADGIADGSFTGAASAEEIAERIVAMTDGLSAQAGIGSSRMSSEKARNLLLRFAAEQLGIPAGQLNEHAYIPGITPSRRTYPGNPEQQPAGTAQSP